MDGFRTDDLALASVLSLEGYELTMEKSGEVVSWVVSEDQVEPALDTLVDDYRHGMYRVEPRKFARSMHAVRRKMYELLDKQPKKRPRPSVPEST